MRSEPLAPSPRSRSRAEAAFAVLRVLIRGHMLWAGGGGLSFEALPLLVDAPPTVLRAAVERLIADGVVAVSAGDCTLRLSDATLHEMRHSATVH